MMKTLLTLSFVLCTASCSAQAQLKPVQWLEGGNTIQATAIEKPAARGITVDDTVQVLLPTGSTATLRDDVYVKTTDAAVVYAWAAQRGYLVTPHRWVADALMISVPATQSLDVAQQVSTLNGVTTAAPRYKVRKVLK